MASPPIPDAVFSVNKADDEPFPVKIQNVSSYTFSSFANNKCQLVVKKKKKLLFFNFYQELLKIII